MDKREEILKEFVEQVQKLVRYADGNFMGLLGNEAKIRLIELLPDAHKLAEKVSEWVAVSDRQPDCTDKNEYIQCSEEVQIFDAALGVNQGWLKIYVTEGSDPLYPNRKKGDWVFENTQYTFHNVTHWMPLPAPPITNP